MSNRTLFDRPTKPKKQRELCPGKACRRHIVKAVEQLLKQNPTCEHIGEVLDCFHVLAKSLEERMHE